MESTGSVFVVSHLKKIYPGQHTPDNDDISFDVEEGDIFGLLGDNGAGKTTPVKQMANLLRPTSGSMTLYGKSVQRDPFLVPRFVGSMPRAARTLNTLTVGEAL